MQITLGQQYNVGEKPFLSVFFSVFFFTFMLSLELYYVYYVDVPLIFSCPADHVTDW